MSLAGGATGGPERVRAKRQQIPWVSDNLRADEDAERAPGLTGQGEDILTRQIQTLRARGRWDDTIQTLNSPFRGEEDRQAFILHFQNLSAVVFPGGRCTTHYLWLHYVI